jgi:hypothetical protein
VPKVWGKAKPEWAQEIEAQVRIVEDRNVIAVKSLLRRWMWGFTRSPRKPSHDRRGMKVYARPERVKIA